MGVEALKISTLSLRHLKAVLHVANFRNVSRAAEKLNRSQTAITKAIGDLEQQLGVRLFDRSTTGMLPTVYGAALANRVQLAMAELEEAGFVYQQYKKDDRNIHNNPIFSMDISYKRLAAFIALYETRDFSASAKLLEVTQAAVYNSVRQLEELLDLKLFNRDPGGVSATPYCDILARHVKLAFAQIRHAIDDLANLDGITTGSVTIGSLPYSRTILTPRAIIRLTKEHPDLDISTVEGPYKLLESSLRSGDIDIIIGATRKADTSSNLKTETLLNDRLSVIVRQGHPLAERKDLTLQDLENLNWILPAKQTPARSLFDEFLSVHNMDAPEHALETSSLSTIRGLLLESDRVALLSEHQIYYDKKFGLLTALPINLESTYRPIGITMRSHTTPSPAAQLFLDCLREVAKEMKP